MQKYYNFITKLLDSVSLPNETPTLPLLQGKEKSSLIPSAVTFLTLTNVPLCRNLKVKVLNFRTEFVYLLKFRKSDTIQTTVLTL